MSEPIVSVKNLQKWYSGVHAVKGVSMRLGIETNDWILDRQCLKRKMEPEHVANLVPFLVSAASEMVSG